jgi:hypothetical protein
MNTYWSLIWVQPWTVIFQNGTKVRVVVIFTTQTLFYTHITLKWITFINIIPMTTKIKSAEVMLQHLAGQNQAKINVSQYKWPYYV